MKLATFALPGEVPAIGAVLTETSSIVRLQDGHHRLFGRPEPAFTSMLALIEAGAAALDLAREVADRAAGEEGCLFPLDGTRLLSPVPVPASIRDFSTFEKHMRQSTVGMRRLRTREEGLDELPPRPEEIALPPINFRQPTYYKGNRFSVVGHEADVRWPSYARLLDFELEFGAFIGTGGRDIAREDAARHIFGYALFNDFSARDTQLAEAVTLGGPAKAKDFDTGNVIGPWIVTAEEIPDPYNLTLVARINGEEWSRGTSADMLHHFDAMIAHVSRDETLHAGEFFGSGTFGGGCGLELDRWIKPGDVIELEGEGLGVLRNRVVGPSD